MQITFEHVDYYYNTLEGTRTRALADVSLDLSSYNMTAIVGHTGSGKSTAMQHINGLLQATHGRVHIDGLTITAKKNKQLLQIRKRIGYVFQNPSYQLFAQSVIEDVMYGPLNFGYTQEQARTMAEKALEMVDISEALYERYPFELSGGQMRKVAIAGVLAYLPDVLILDEPTVGLDPLAVKQMIELFTELHVKHQKTLIFITHDMEFVHAIAKRVIVFAAGEVAFDNTPHQLFGNPAATAAFALEAPFLYQLAHRALTQEACDVLMQRKDKLDIAAVVEQLQQGQVKEEQE